MFARKKKKSYRSDLKVGLAGKEGTIPETVAEIDLAALKKNLRQVIRRIGKRKIIAVVKADAYGHGAIPVSRCFLETSPQVSMLGVASLSEAIQLRNAKIKAPILLMTGCPIDGIPDLAHYRLTPALYDEATLLGLSRYIKKTGRPIPVHLKVDTGMGRLGLSPEKAVDFMQKAEAAGLKIAGLFSHFADADLADPSYAREQLARFQKIVSSLTRETVCHMANSAAILTFSDAHLDGVRPGLMLYGYSPLSIKKDFGLEPAMTVKSRILFIKNVPPNTPISYGRTFVTQRATTVAVVAIGYADGYPRLLSNCGEMIVKGNRVPVIGRVCMDMTLLDVTSVPSPSLRVGDWVTVMGREGKEAIGADRLAEKAQTIPYEILCGICAQIPRIYR